VSAGILLTGVLAARGERIPAPRSWGNLALIGLLLVCIGNGGVILAEQWVPSGVSAVTVASMPFWMLGVEALRGDRDPLSTRLVAGLLVGFAGILLLVWPDVAGGSGGHQFLIGIVALQVACVGWAIGSTLSRRHAPDESVLMAAALQMLFGGVFMMIAGTLDGEWRRLAFNARTIAAESYLTIFGSIVGYSAYTYALKYLPTATVSLYAYANPVIAVVLGAALLGEPFGVRVVGSTVMVLAGSALVQRGGHGERQPRRHEVTENRKY